MVGRTSGRVRLRVVETADSRECLAAVDDASRPRATISTDEWNGYSPLDRRTAHKHWTVDHSKAKSQWALDLDGDGVREVHCNTQEGIWTGLRNFLRPFRGVHKRYLSQYVALFEWGYNLKQVTNEFLRALLANTLAAT